MPTRRDIRAAAATVTTAAMKANTTATRVTWKNRWYQPRKRCRLTPDTLRQRYGSDPTLRKPRLRALGDFRSCPQFWTPVALLNRMHVRNLRPRRVQIRGP